MRNVVGRYGIVVPGELAVLVDAGVAGSGDQPAG